ncbi:PKD domain-containing protein [Haloarcula marina]|uniref:PKD domain-containing protein n=1 Tax=Haloarcula marina TaxID=2961574 RepID=UPI0020B87874|nr:PKD domain-containing protein [Halomicroarcula marina]
MSAASAERRQSTGRGRVAGRRLLAVALFCALAVLASGTVAAADTEAPEFGNATKGNATTIHVTVYDNGTLDTGSIAAADFVTTRGTVENISVADIDAGENRTGARVSLYLAERLNANNVTVGIRSAGGIADTAGNKLRDGTVTVSGMDTVTPRYRSFEIRRVNASTVEIRAAVNEPLDGLSVSIGGPVTDRLNRSDFTESVGDAVVYTARYTFPEEGAYPILWLNATDRYGNTVKLSRLRSFRYDGSAPNVTLDGPTNATVGETLNFTARNSTDEQGIDRYRWRIDGGTLLPGPSIQVAFATPGAHEVAVEATDPFGNAATVARTVTVTRDGDASGLNVSQPNATTASTTVVGTGFAQRITAPNDSLVTTANASLDRVTVTLPANETVPLTVRARNRTPFSFLTVTGDAGLATFAVDHGGVPVDRATFTFTVPRPALNEASPSAVTLYRDDDGWSALDTAVVSRNETRVVYQASSPGLSRFAVGVGDGADARPTETATETPGPTRTPVENETATATESEAEAAESGGDAQAASESQSTGTPDIEVTNVTAEPDSLAVRDSVVLTVEVTNDGTATGDYLVGVFLNDSTLATREVTVPAGETRTTEFSRELDDSGPLEVGTTRVANVTGGGGFSLPSLGAPSGLPNPLSLWPSGIVGTILGAVVGLVVVVYGILKALAIYLGY